MFGLGGVYRRFLVAERVRSCSVVRFAHGEPYDDPNLNGWRRKFNGETIRGRANFAKLYWCIYITAFIVYKINKKIKAKNVPTH